MEPSQRRRGLAHLLGIGGESILWSRLVMFFLAELVAELPFIVSFLLQQPKGVPAFVSTWLLRRLVAGLAFTLAAWVVLWFVRNEWLGAALAGLVYAGVMTAEGLALIDNYAMDQRILYSWLWAFLTLIGLSLALRVLQSTFLALFLGSWLASVLSTVGVVLIEHLRAPAYSWSLSGELENLLLDLLSSAFFAVVLWAGLRLSWCKPELLDVLPAPAASEASPANMDDLRVYLDFKALRSRLRSAGIGSLIFGVLAMGLGAESMRENPLNGVLALLGVILVVEGIAVLAAPSPGALIIDGIVLILLGIWNIVTIVASHGGGTSGHFAVIGVMQIIWGIQSIAQHGRYAHLRGVAFTPDVAQNLEQRVAAIWKEDLLTASDLVEFRTKALFKDLTWRGKLLSDSLVMVRTKAGPMAVPKAATKLVLAKNQSHADPLKAKLSLEQLTLDVTISRDSFDRLQRWLGVPPAVPS